MILLKELNWFWGAVLPKKARKTKYCGAMRMKNNCTTKKIAWVIQTIYIGLILISFENLKVSMFQILGLIICRQYL